MGVTGILMQITFYFRENNGRVFVREKSSFIQILTPGDTCMVNQIS